MVLAHAGFTLGAAAIVSGACSYFKDRRGRTDGKPGPSADRSPRVGSHLNIFSPLASLGDIRFLLLGSLLPDIIDKPLGVVFFPQIFHNSRIIAHTLFFLVLLLVAAFLLSKKNKGTVFWMLAAGVGMHLVLDAMWRDPFTLLWPGYGFMFAYRDLEGWLMTIIQDMVTDPTVYVSELAGGVILLWFGIVLLRTHNVRSFIRCGSLT